MAKNPLPIWKGFVLKGIMTLHKRKEFDGYLQTLFGEVEVIVRKPERTRTHPQNAYLWMVYGIIAKHTGHTTEEIHEVMKKMFNKKLVTVGSHVVEIGATSTTLSTVAFSEFVENVRMFASTDLGLVIPDAKSVEM